MRLLLDTHAFLWASGEPERLPRAAREATTDPANEIFVSTLVAWEVAIKAALGQLPSHTDVATWLPPLLDVLSLRTLPVELRHAVAVERLPLHHRDPLIAQAQVEGLTIVTADDKLRAYDVPIIWA